MTIEEKAKVYYQHMVNAYREPDDRVDPGIVLELKKGMDMTEELAAMMMAMMWITDRVEGGMEVIQRSRRIHASSEQSGDPEQRF